ncbi:MAG: signal recognition particle-docking protein FtsY [Gammaproteobacteria bacterium]|nr:signal recognition particle-docking protein FtsY [Gammaproteobacteria bacterium]
MLKFFQRNKDKDNVKNELNQKSNLNIQVDSTPSIFSTQDTQDIQTEKRGFFSKLYSGLEKTRKQLFGGLGGVSSFFTGKVIINEELWEELEAHLLQADVGIDLTREILSELTKEIKYKDSQDINSLKIALKNKLNAILAPCERELDIRTIINNNINSPVVILMVGVNGAGKTTTIGKLTSQFKAQGYSVMLAAGDTFRAAAIEQLTTWGERNNVPVVAQKTGADSASVIFDAYQSAKSKKIDILIADTAGRLHTQSHLMQELAKIKRVLEKQDSNVPQEVMLVIDAGMGQNALQQAKQFLTMVKVTGIVITKLDGTAKGGIVFAIAKQLNIPIRYIGIGEGIEDLQKFDGKSFVNALIGDQE